MKHLRQALTRSFNDAVNNSKPFDVLALGREILKKNLREKIVEREPGSTFGPADQPGYSMIEGVERSVVVNARQFRSWFVGRAQVRRVLEWLSSEGRLKQAEDAVKGAVTQGDLDGVTLHWPNGKVVRSFTFRDPFLEPSDPDAAAQKSSAGAQSPQGRSNDPELRRASPAAPQRPRKASSVRGIGAKTTKFGSRKRPKAAVAEDVTLTSGHKRPTKSKPTKGKSTSPKGKKAERKN